MPPGRARCSRPRKRRDTPVIPTSGRNVAVSSPASSVMAASPRNRCSVVRAAMTVRLFVGTHPFGCPQVGAALATTSAKPMSLGVRSGRSGPNQLARIIDAGAFIMGCNMFGPARGAWDDHLVVVIGALDN